MTASLPEQPCPHEPTTSRTVAGGCAKRRARCALARHCPHRPCWRLRDSGRHALGDRPCRRLEGGHQRPHCAPLPTPGVYASGVVLTGPAWRWRCVEVEVAFRLGRDLDPHGELLPPEELAEAFDAVLPAIEVVESRLAEGETADPLAHLADLQCHGALVLGSPCTLLPSKLDLRAVEASLSFGAVSTAQTRGGNPEQDVWRLRAWLAVHCAGRGQPLRAGQIVTTGSCTGLLTAPMDATVRGEIAGVGTVGLRFGPQAQIASKSQLRGTP